jgi:hypothetical protein
MLTEYVKQYIEKYNNMIDENLQEFIDEFFKSGYKEEDAECFFKVLDTLNYYTDIDQAIKTTQDKLAHDSMRIAQKYDLENNISVCIMKHDQCLKTKQDIIEAKTFGNIHLNVHVLDPKVSDTKLLRIGFGRAFITDYMSEDIKLNCPNTFINTLEYFYKYNIYCEPYLKKFEAFCKKLAFELKKK